MVLKPDAQGIKFGSPLVDTDTLDVVDVSVPRLHHCIAITFTVTAVLSMLKESIDEELTSGVGIYTATKIMDLRRIE